MRAYAGSLLGQYALLGLNGGTTTLTTIVHINDGGGKYQAEYWLDNLTDEFTAYIDNSWGAIIYSLDGSFEPIWVYQFSNMYSFSDLPFKFGNGFDLPSNTSAIKVVLTGYQVRFST